jgi:hypothetical protein
MTAVGVAIAGALLIVVIMWDAFEALVLPRRVTRRLRPTRLFYRTTWWLWRAVARRMRSGGRRETYLSFYGPLSLLFLLGTWALSLVVGFAIVHWGLGSSLDVAHGSPSVLTDLYMSGTTFFTLGLGDVTPHGTLARILTVVEAGTGFGFLAVVISYLPVVYQGFSRREVNIVLLDARAGSPPTAAELLRGYANRMAELELFLRDWERWAAELLESHVSYPVLSYFRSQHDNQSWLAALTTVLDASALVIAGIKGAPAWQAELTFAMARHAVADLAQVLAAPPRMPSTDRLPTPALQLLRERLATHGLLLADSETADQTLAQLRSMYEPYAEALAERLLMPLPAWSIAGEGGESWRTTAWSGSGGETALGADPARGLEH